MHHPHFDQSALPDDQSVTPEKKAKKEIKRVKAKTRWAEHRAAEGVPALSEPGEVNPPFIVPGYVGKNKGIMQVLYERGLYVEGMQGQQCQKTKEKFKAHEQLDRILPPELDAHAVLRNCTDFLNERNALQEAVESRGHILRTSVICTPETAGLGIEFAFGKMKFEQRKGNEGKKLLGGQVFTEGIKILCTEGALQHLPMERVWKFNRRARDYERVYMSASGRDGDHSLTHAEIESMRKKMTSHRNIMEQERKFIRAV